VGRWGDGPSSAVTTSGAYAFAGSGTMLLVLDISDPTHPALVGKVDTMGEVKDIVVKDDRAYVAASKAGLSIVDVSNPAAPRQVGFCNTEGTALSVAVSGNFAFVADYTGLSIIDVLGPRPRAVGFVAAVDRTVEVRVSGHFVYLNELTAIRILDISNPRSPQQLVSYNPIPYASTIEILGDYLYWGTRAANVGGELHVLDISNPAHLVETAKLPVLQIPTEFSVSGGCLYMTGNNHGLWVFDLADPSEPREAWCGAHTGVDVAVLGDFVILATGLAGISVVDVSNFSGKQKAVYTPIGAPAAHVALANGNANACVLETGGDLRIFDISQPGVLSPVGLLGIGPMVYDMSVLGSYAFVVGMAGLWAVDVSVPTNPVQAAYVQLPGSAIALSGKYAYVPSSAGLRVIDVATPSSPKEVNLLTGYRSGNRIAVFGQIACLAETDKTLDLFTLTDPLNPSALGSYRVTRRTTDIAMSGSLLYVADGASVLVLDISLPAAIKQVNTLGPATSLYVSGTTLLAADQTGLIRFFDISNPANPVEYGGYRAFGFPAEFKAIGQVVYFVSSTYGLASLDISNPDLLASAELAYYDVPWRTVAVAFSGQYALAIENDRYRMHVLDLANRAEPKEIGVWETSNALFKVAVEGRYAYLAEAEGIRVLDLQNPSEPVEVGFCALSGIINDLVIRGPYLYLAAGGVGLTILDISDPVHPKFVASASAGYPLSIAVCGNWACLGDSSYGLRFVDITNPIAPKTSGTIYPQGRFLSVASDGLHFYCIEAGPSGEGMLVIDAPDHVVAKYQVPLGVRGVAVAGSRLFASGSGMLRVIDISNPSAPVQMSVRETAGGAAGVAVSDQLVVVADETCGVSVFQY